MSEEKKRRESFSLGSVYYKKEDWYFKSLTALVTFHCWNKITWHIYFTKEKKIAHSYKGFSAYTAASKAEMTWLRPTWHRKAVLHLWHKKTKDKRRARDEGPIQTQSKTQLTKSPTFLMSRQSRLINTQTYTDLIVGLCNLYHLLLKHKCYTEDYTNSCQSFWLGPG